MKIQIENLFRKCFTSIYEFIVKLYIKYLPFLARIIYDFWLWTRNKKIWLQTIIIATTTTSIKYFKRILLNIEWQKKTPMYIIIVYQFNSLFAFELICFRLPANVRYCFPQQWFSFNGSYFVFVFDLNETQAL